MSSAAGAVCVWVQVKPRFWLWVCDPVQFTEESALARKCSTREEPCAQPATGLPQPTGTPDIHRVNENKLLYCVLKN